MNSFGTIKYTVKSAEGAVSCSQARRVARLLFEGKGCHHDGGAGYKSWYVVPGGWMGDVRMDFFVLHNRRTHATLSGVEHPVYRERIGAAWPIRHC
jgi:hypothetical protein